LLHASLLHIAAAKGYFAEEGLDVSITITTHGKTALDLMAQGKVEMVAAAEVPFVISVIKGEPLAIVATLVSVANATEIVARRDRAIASPRDLQGKKIGVTFGTGGDYSTWAFLIRHRLAPSSITLVDVAPGKMVSELLGGKVDAVSTWEPIKSDVQAALAGNGLSFTEPDVYTGTFALIGRIETLKARASATEKLVRALLKAEAFNRADPQGALKLLAGRLKLDTKALEPGWSDFTFRVDLNQSLLITLEDEARWAMARGYVDKGPTPNFLAHLYLDALLAAQPERVTVVR
jgi:NitT/TauT family transport system substrate-binding protein